MNAPEVAITIRQPWASAIALDHPGAKRVENRGRPTTYRGPVAIHAGKTPDRVGDRDWRVTRLFGDDPRLHLPVGAVIAVANLYGCHRAQPVLSADGVCCAPWGERRHHGKSGPVQAWHLVLADVVRLPQPVPARGALNVPWRMPADVADQVAAQLADVAAARAAVSA